MNSDDTRQFGESLIKEMKLRGKAKEAATEFLNAFAQVMENRQDIEDITKGLDYGGEIDQKDVDAQNSLRTLDSTMSEFMQCYVLAGYDLNGQRLVSISVGQSIQVDSLPNVLRIAEARMNEIVNMDINGVPPQPNEGDDYE